MENPNHNALLYPGGGYIISIVEVTERMNWTGRVLFIISCKAADISQTSNKDDANRWSAVIVLGIAEVSMFV